jgi:hypothetical protein
MLSQRLKIYHLHPIVKYKILILLKAIFYILFKNKKIIYMNKDYNSSLLNAVQ